MKNLLLFFSLFVFTFSSCEKEELVSISDDSLQGEVTARAGDCDFNVNTNQVRIFDLCGVDLMFQGSLRITNNDNIHRIQAVGKCHKLGAPDSPVAVTEISVDVWGDASIWCTFPIDILEPSDYNANLVNGEVPSYEDCQNCDQEIVNIEYVKNITRSGNERIKAKISITAEACGELYEDSILLEI